MVADSFHVKVSYLTLLNQLLCNVLTVTSTRETMDHWENVQEVLRMAASCFYDQESRQLLCRLSLLICVAMGDGFNTDEGDTTMLRSWTTDETSGLHVLLNARALHLKEFNRAYEDLALLLRHLREAEGCAETCEEITKALGLIEEIELELGME